MFVTKLRRLIAALSFCLALLSQFADMVRQGRLNVSVGCDSGEAEGDGEQCCPSLRASAQGRRSNVASNRSYSSSYSHNGEASSITEKDGAREVNLVVNITIIESTRCCCFCF